VSTSSSITQETQPPLITRNTNPEFERIVVPVCLERAVTEETAVVQLNTEHATLTASKDIKNKFDEVSIDRDKTEELDVEQQYADDTALTAHKYIENVRAVFKKISVPVETERAETEVQSCVKSQNAGSAALTAHKTAKLTSWLPRRSSRRSMC
jgi:hypothetical protein